MKTSLLVDCDESRQRVAARAFGQRWARIKAEWKCRTNDFTEGTLGQSITDVLRTRRSPIRPRPIDLCAKFI